MRVRVFNLGLLSCSSLAMLEHKATALAIGMTVFLILKRKEKK